jgi:hypothetical protein
VRSEFKSTLAPFRGREQEDSSSGEPNATIRASGGFFPMDEGEA